jgi:hypothetical protein
LKQLGNPVCLPAAGFLQLRASNREPVSGDDCCVLRFQQAGADMSIHRALRFSILMSAISMAGPALAQNCTWQGVDIACDDGRRGMLSGDTIIFADGTRSSLTSPHPSVIIGNKSSVAVGQGVFAGKANGVVPMQNPSDPKRARCPILDGVAYCH